MAALLGVGKEAAREARRGSRAGRGVPARQRQRADAGRAFPAPRRAIDRAAQLAKAHGVRRFMPLNVSAPFHCALMQPAADAMAEALAKVEIKAPAVPLIANVLAAPISDPAEIRQRLVEQVTGTVRWRECVARMAADGVTDIYEIGSGKVLAGLAKRIVPTLNATSIGTPQDIEAALPRCSRIVEDAHVRAHRQDRARHRRHRRHRRRHRPRAAQAGRDRRHLRPPGRQAREAGRRARLARARAALRSRQQGAGRQADRRGDRQARAASTSSSTTPASPRTTCSW